MAAAVAEYVLAVRVIVMWEKAKWPSIVVAIAFMCTVSSTAVLFALDSPKFSKAKHVYLSEEFNICLVECPCYAALWKVWVTLLVYNSVLGLLVFIKAVATYKRDMLRRESLRYIIVQGSIQYYAMIIALSTGVLFISQFADPVTLMAASDLVLVITIVLACRVILDIRQAYYKPVVKGEPSLPTWKFPLQNRDTLMLA